MGSSPIVSTTKLLVGALRAGDTGVGDELQAASRPRERANQPGLAPYCGTRKLGEDDCCAHHAGLAALDERSTCLGTLVASVHATPPTLDETTDALLDVSRALVAVAARSIAAIDAVTLAQFRALVVLTRPEPVTVSDLAEALDVHPSTTTRLCDRLERKRLVRRHPGAAPDRRETTVQLTARGRRLVQRVTERRRRDLKAIASVMDADARAEAVVALRAFARAAGELPALDPFSWTGASDDESASAV